MWLDLKKKKTITAYFCVHGSLNSILARYSVRLSYIIRTSACFVPTLTAPTCMKNLLEYTLGMNMASFVYNYLSVLFALNYVKPNFKSSQ